MLNIERREGETFNLTSDTGVVLASVTIRRIDANGRVHLGVHAPPWVRIDREIKAPAVGVCGKR